MKLDKSLQTKRFFKWVKNSKKYIMLHHTGSDAPDERQAQYLTYNRGRQVSCHYVVWKHWKVWQLADDDKCTWHAGRGSWNWIYNAMNMHSIGIEVCSNGRDFTIDQLNETTKLIKYLMKKNNIPARNVIRHKDYSPGRKFDIGDNFRYPQYKSWAAYQEALEDQKTPSPQEKKNEPLSLVEDGIWNGERPHEPATRLEVAIMLNRIANKILKHK